MKTFSLLLGDDQGNEEGYRLLVASGQHQSVWKAIRAGQTGWRLQVSPSITESDIFSLLGEYHIIGKKDWQPLARPFLSLSLAALNSCPTAHPRATA